MDRSKRAIRTPKRFDDEAFGPAPKIQQPSKQVESATPTRSLPESTAPKSIIKVKLARARPRESVEPLRSASTPSKMHPKVAAKSPQKLQSATLSPAPATTAPPSPTPSPSPSQSTPASLPPPPPITPKDRPIKIKLEPSSRVKTEPPPKIKLETPSRIRAEPPAKIKTEPPSKVRSEPPTKIIKPKIKDIPLVTNDRDSQLVYRPKTKRPRTPPTYNDVIPNVVLPFWDARTAAEDHEDDNVKELVHCHCGIAEELGLMVQCETCLTWQHAHCLGIDKAEEAPDGYTCKACSDPKCARESMKWAYDQDWLVKGRLKQFPCDRSLIPENRVNILKQINHLINNVLQIYQLTRSLRIKSKILTDAQDDDTDLKLFRNQWPANYQHLDGSTFVSTINQPSCTPASTISAIPETETPDPGEIAVETVADVPLPDIGQLEDVTAILENSFPASQALMAPVTQALQAPSQPLTSNTEATPDDCRANLRLHIQQTEEFIALELDQIEEKLVGLERECSDMKGNFDASIESLKNDLMTMKKYIAYEGQCEN